jgi:site-specific recombinase XerD
MDITDSIIDYRRYLKRRNYSPHTVKNYLNALKLFVVWVDVPIEAVNRMKIKQYLDHLHNRRLRPKTINCHLGSIRMFYDFLNYEQGIHVINPVGKGLSLRVPKPLPRFLTDDEVCLFLEAVKKLRDRAIFMVMLRCGLRVEEVANVCLNDVDLLRKRLHVRKGKGSKERVVYISDDACLALERYLARRLRTRAEQIFLVEKGPCRGQPISVRGIQKRIEYYAEKSGVEVSCHRLRHTMATQLLNAGADLATIQDLLGHNWITTTQRYCKVSNLKVQKDYDLAIKKVMERTGTSDNRGFQ